MSNVFSLKIYDQTFSQVQAYSMRDDNRLKNIYTDLIAFVVV